MIKLLVNKIKWAVFFCHKTVVVFLRFWFEYSISGPVVQKVDNAIHKILKSIQSSNANGLPDTKSQDSNLIIAQNHVSTIGDWSYC